MSEPFKYVDAVSDTKVDVVRDGSLPESGYNPFLTNRSMSYHADAVLYANDMNMMSGLSSIMQFDFYMQGLRKRRRRSKWYKTTTSDDERAVARVLGCSARRAREAVRVLSDDDMKRIRALEKEVPNE